MDILRFRFEPDWTAESSGLLYAIRQTSIKTCSGFLLFFWSPLQPSVLPSGGTLSVYETPAQGVNELNINFWCTIPLMRYSRSTEK